MHSLASGADTVFEISNTQHHLSELYCRKGDLPAWTHGKEIWKSTKDISPASLDGYYWLRRDIKLSVNCQTFKPAIGIQIYPGAAYEVYLDGAKVASQGSFPPVIAHSNKLFLSIHELPIQPNKVSSLALRIWLDPEFKALQYDNLRLPSIILGEYTHLKVSRLEQILDDRDKSLFSYTLSVLFFVVGLYHLHLYRRRKALKEYLFYGLIACLFSINSAMLPLWRAEVLSFKLAHVMARTTASATLMLSLPFFVTLLSIRFKFWMKAQTGLCILAMLVYMSGKLEFVTGRSGLFLLFVCGTITVLTSLWILIKQLPIRKQQLLSIMLGFSVLALLVLVYLIDIINVFDVPLSPMLKRELPKTGFAIFIYTMAISLANRFVDIHNELEELNKKLEQKVAERTQEIARQHEEIELKNKNIIESITYAQKIQQSMLPTPERLKEKLDVFVIYRPKDIVSGDFYWFYETPSAKFLAVIDCEGHGVPAAMTAVMATVLLSQIMKEQINSPAQILSLLEEALGKFSRENINLDILLCRIDELGITVALAGRPLYYSTQSGEIGVLSKSFSFSGKKKEVKKKEEKFLSRWEGMMIYLTTDGFIDQNSELIPRYSSRRFVELLSRIHTLPTEVQKSLLEAEFDAFCRNTPQRDDVTIIGVKL
ncbi:MAG: SpoIIE family protein phosphatase [Blastocatellia bacterium]|nr:SpoIIE family protein phosphatase [Blastocatellia bacterium]